MERVDLKDKKLICELDLNSRQSASQLGKKVGLSKQGVSLKINNLIKKGVIRSFISVLNTPLLGRLSFRLYFKLIDISPLEEKAFRNYLIKHLDVSWVVGCEGIWDYMVVVFPENFESFEKFMVDINNKFGKFIERKDLALVTRAYHFRSGYLLGKKKNIPDLIYAGQPAKVIKFDSKDERIISLLAKNSRISFVEMSSKVGLNVKTIVSRIERLRKLNVLEGHIITVDYDKLGFERYKVFIRTKNLNEVKEKSFIDSMRVHPYVLYYSKSIGSSDVELELIVKDSLHLREIISEIREGFGNSIKSYETMKIYAEYKLDFFPFR